MASVASSFALWGLYPLYFKQLAAVSPLQVICHRVIWCALLVFGWLAWRRSLGEVWLALRHRRKAAALTLSAALISANWLLYVWAVGNGHVLDASLGYFINPLVNILLGVAFLGEQLNRAKWLAVALAAAGVAWISVQAGGIPWLSLSLAVQFSGYGLVRKLVPISAVGGLAVETLVMTPLAVGWLAWCFANGSGAFGSISPHIDLLLVGCGLVTAVPLVLFATGARVIPLSMTGVLQYFSPTIQFALGVLVFGEPFPVARAVGFVLIWVALVVYLTDALRGR